MKDKLRSRGKLPKFLTNNAYSWLAALLAVAIMLFVMLCHKIYPFGNMTILRMDLYHQYGPLYAELFDKIKSGGSLFYSWTSGLGGAFLGNLLNYCTSPFAIVMLIAGHYHMPGAIAAMITLKAALAAWTFTYFIRKSFGKSDLSSVAFAIAYTFCGWYVAYYWDLMWVDAFAVFPLVILGLEYVIQDKKPWLFILSLSYVMFTSYYMAYMTVLMSVIYFLYYYFGRYSIGEKRDPLLRGRTVVYTNDEGEELQKTLPPSFLARLRNSRFLVAGIRFAFSGLAAALIAMCALLPVYFSLKTSSATNDNWPSTYKLYFNFFDFLANHLASLDTTIRSSGDIVLPNVYCTMATVVAAPLYFFCKKIHYKKKIASAFILVLFYASFVLNYVNFVWHGFHFPNDLPFRWSYMYSFFLILLAYEAFRNIKSFDYRQILLSGLGVFIFIIVVQKVEQKNVSTSTVYISLAFTAIFTLLYMIMQDRRWQKAALSLFMLCAVVTEIVVADTGHYNVSQSKEAYAGDYYDYQNIRELTEQNDSSLFYRTELTNLKARMDPCWYGYRGTSTFTSMAYEPVAKLERKLGVYGNNINSYTYSPQTPVFNSMHALKYLYDKTDNNYISEDRVYNYEFANDKFTSYSYKYYLPIAYAVKSDLREWEYDSSDSPIAVQSDYVLKTSGIANVYENIPIDSVDYENINNFYPAEIESGNFTYYKTNSSEDYSAVTMHITMPRTQRLCLYVDCNKLKNASIVSETYTGTRNFDEPMILDFGDFPAGEEIQITLSITDSESGSLKFRAAGMNQNTFISWFNKIVGEYGTLNLTEFSDTHLKGNITVGGDAGLLYTSIPYDAGWNAYVDGVDVSRDIEKVGDAYMALPISAGEHTVEFRFTPSGVIPGLAVSAVVWAALIALALIQKKKGSALKEKLAGVLPVEAAYYTK